MGLKQKTFKYWIDIYLYNNTLILPIKRRHKGWGGNVILLCLSPYIILNYLFSLLYERIYGFRKVNGIMKNERSKTYKYELAMVSISKNEGPYLLEWIEYYRIMGVNKFYFYDNESADNTIELLTPYINAGIIEYTHIKGVGKQLDAYNDAIMKHKEECRWMAFVDMDEYIMPIEPNKHINEVVNELVESAGAGAAGLGINWATFGTSGHRKKPDGLITYNFTRRASDSHWMNKHVKTICNPRMVKTYISPHYPFYIRGAYSIDENGNRQKGWGCPASLNIIKINHYVTKSAEDYLRKCNRGIGDRAGKYDFNDLKKLDFDDVTDTTARIYSDKLNKRLATYPHIIETEC